MLCVLLAVDGGTALAQTLDIPALSQAAALVRAGKADEAFQLLAPLERQYAGRPDFDYPFAIAALESGRPERATFILERVIAVNPGHVAARLEMARAYFALRDYERAEREFEAILKSGPPDAIRSLVRDYLARLRGTAAPDGGFSGYAEAAFGRDTNVGAATAQTSLFVPSLGTNFVLDPLFTRRPDDFLRLGAGFEYAHELGAGFGLFGGADLATRSHANVSVFDSRAVDLHGVLGQRLNHQDRMRYTLHHQEYDLDHGRYRRMQSAAALWSRTLEQRMRVSLSGQAYRIRYLREDVAENSSDLLSASANVAYAFDAATRTIGAGSIYFAKDSAVAGRVDGDRNLYGLSAGVQRRLFGSVDGFLSASLLRSDYAQANVDFAVTRRDRQRDTVGGLSWDLGRGWFLLGQVAHTRNKSNLPLNEYRRTETSLAVRRVWD